MYLLLAYFLYEALIGLPLALYFHFSHWNVEERGRPKVLRIFPVAGRIFRVLADDNSSLTDDRGRLRFPKMTFGKWVMAVYGILGIIGFSWLFTTDGPYLFDNGGNLIEAGIWYFFETIFALIGLVAALLYIPGFLFMYYFLVYLPAKRKALREEENRRWEAYLKNTPPKQEP